MDVNGSFKVRFGENIYDTFVFTRLYDALKTELEVFFDNGANQRVAVENDIFTKIDVRVCNFMMHSFGEIMYFFPDSKNELVNAAKKMRQDRKMFDHITEYFQLFARTGFDKKLIWYNKNTDRDRKYQKEIENMNALHDKVKIELKLNLEQIEILETEVEVLKSSIKTHGKACPAEQLKALMAEYTMINGENNSLKEKLDIVNFEYAKVKENMEQIIETQQQQLSEVQLDYDLIDKLNDEIAALQSELDQSVKENKKLHKKIENYSKQHVSENGSKGYTNNLDSKLMIDAYASTDELVKTFCMKNVDVNGIFSLWNFEYNHIVKKINHMIMLGVVSYDSCLEVIKGLQETSLNSIDFLKKMSSKFNVKISTLFG